MKAVRAIAGAGLLWPLLVGATPSSGSLEVQVDNVRGHKGLVHVDLCTQNEFLNDCARSVDVPAAPGVTRVVVTGLPPGRYAVQAFYDENANHKVDRALFGIPKEGVGFSNDAKIRMSPPRWSEAAFDFDGQPRVIRFRLRYFIGPNAPR